MTGENYTPIASKPIKGLRLLFPGNAVLDGADDHVATSYAQVLSQLSAAGAIIVEQAVPPFDQLPGINAQGGFIAAEAWAWHRQLIADKADAYDPRVSRACCAASKLAPPIISTCCSAARSGYSNYKCNWRTMTP